MARVRWFGTEFIADPIEERPDGSWLMRSREHTGRLSVGTEFVAKPKEIIEMAAAEIPPPAISMAALEAAMAEERKLLPSPQSLIAQAHGKKPDGGTEPSK